MVSLLSAMVRYRVDFPRQQSTFGPTAYCYHRVGTRLGTMRLCLAKFIRFIEVS